MNAVFKWTYHVFFGAEDSFDALMDLLNQIPTNKTLGLLYANDTDGNAVHDVELPILKQGFKIVDGSGFSDGTEDFSSIISQFKKGGAEMGHGLLLPTDFVNFWKQAIQQSWVPKVSVWGKALLFPQSLQAIGSIGHGLCADQWWGADWPYTSALLNQNCRQFTDAYESKTNSQWTQPVGHFMLFEWAYDVLKRTTSVDDKNAIMTAVKGTKLQTIIGPVDFTGGIARTTLEVGSAARRRERVQDQPRDRPVGQGHQVAIRPGNGKQRGRPDDPNRGQAPTVLGELNGPGKERRRSCAPPLRRLRTVTSTSGSIRRVRPSLGLA